MSRLIDADKLRINCVCVNGICVDGRTIENAPTVKAIPIEWIVKWYRRALDNSGFMGDETISVGDLLADWEKENEM